MDKINFELDTRIILWGDFNVIFDTFLDADGGSLLSKQIRSIKLPPYCLIMIYATFLGFVFLILKDFLGDKKNPLIQRRLDYFFISNEIQEDVAFIDIVPSVASDHSVVHFKISGAKIKDKGRSYWKFNNSLVEDAIYVEKTESLIKYSKCRDEGHCRSKS